MQLTITVSDSVANRVLDAIASEYNYQPGSETKAQFAKRMVIDFVKSAVRRYESYSAAEAARQQAIDKVNSEIVPT